jgi:hypothetical protein
MTRVALSLFACCVVLLTQTTAPSAAALSKIFRKGDRRPQPSDNVGTPLHLSAYIESGRVEEARRAAEVKMDQFLLHPTSATGGGSWSSSRRGQQQQLFSGSSTRRIVDPPRVSYSGFINVNKSCDSNLFFWFIPAKV